MNLFWSDLLAWCLQIAMVAAVSAALPWLFRLRVSGARLWYWHIVLLICLALPLLEPWAKLAPRSSGVTFTTGAFHLAATPESRHFTITWAVVALGVLLAGIALRLVWLGVGLLRLRRYRTTACRLDQSELFAGMCQTFAPKSEILISGNVTSPVTFGIHRPVILLPGRFASLSEPERASIVCHELIHIRRHDWAVAIAEEIVRAVFWFHPAIWWLLGQIQLTREQVVDQHVIEYTGDPNRYLDALLAIASLQLSADLAPAPLFLKKHHLRQRVESIVSGVTMTKRNLLLPMAAAFATLPLVIGVAAWQFPLRAAPQETADDAGVEVQLGAGKILHRTGISYPEEARAKHISGTVVAGLTLNEKGEVTDAVAVSGPQELRRPVIQSVLNWHFSQESGSTPDLQIAVHFDASKGMVAKGSSWPAHLPADGTARTIESVHLNMLPQDLREKIIQSGLLEAGSVIAPDGWAPLGAALRTIDEHLLFDVIPSSGDKVRLVVLLSQTPEALQSSVSLRSIRVGGNVQSANLVRQIRPAYPPEAKQARIQGTVRLAAVISPEGNVIDLQPVAGHPLLVPSAMEAVKQWVYKPTLLNGSPVQVITTVDINYTLKP